jgi:hypothetical protein
LPTEVRQAAGKAYRLWDVDPHHPSLSFKKLSAVMYSVRMGLNWRAVAIKDGETFIWFFIGSHAEYDKLGRH